MERKEQRPAEGEKLGAEQQPREEREGEMALVKSFKCCIVCLIVFICC